MFEYLTICYLWKRTYMLLKTETVTVPRIANPNVTEGPINT